MEYLEKDVMAEEVKVVVVLMVVQVTGVAMEAMTEVVGEEMDLRMVAKEAVVVEVEATVVVMEAMVGE